MVAHIAVIFSERNTRVNRRLTRRHGHIRGIGNQYRAFQQRFARARVNQLREFLQNLRHFVAAFAAADIDDNIRIAPFGKLVLCHRIARTESPGDCRRAAFGNREYGINHTLSRDKRFVRGQAFCSRSGGANRPFLRKGQFHRFARVRFQNGKRRFDGILPVGIDRNNFTRNCGRHHGFMRNRRGLGAGGEHIAARNTVTDFDGKRHSIFLFGIERRKLRAAPDKCAVFCFDGGQWALNAVKNIAEKPRA